MRIVYMGTPEIAAGVLREVIDLSKERDLEIVGVYTQPDKPVGRRQILTPSPVKVLALENGLDVYQPVRIKRPKPTEVLRSLQPDLILVTAFGQILSQEILDIPPLGCINMHASLLPEYRGAAPIQWSIVDGKQETGVTAMQMDAGIDTGDMILRERVAIEPEETADTLYDKLTLAGARVIREVLERLLRGEELLRTPQDPEKATYAAMIKKEDGCILWNSPAHRIDCQVRGFAGWPGTYSFLRSGEDREGAKCGILKVRLPRDVEDQGLETGCVYSKLLEGKHPRLVVQTGDGPLEITMLQPSCKKAMETEAYLRGTRELPSRFTDTAE